MNLKNITDMDKSELLSTFEALLKSIGHQDLRISTLEIQINALQAIQKENQALKSQIIDLEQRIKDLTAQITDLKVNQHKIVTDKQKSTVKLNNNNTITAAKKKFYEANERNDKVYYADAIKLLTEAIQLNPKDYLLYDMRRIAYRAMGEYEKAQADLAKARELGW